ncbi:MAG: iron-sulfur cluster repair di-iron protein [Ferruginibacter sp.]
MKNLAEQTLASIVISNHHAAPILEKYQLDFCCKGKKTLKDACIEKGLDHDSLSAELFAIEIPRQDTLPFNEMSLTALINYILLNHHFYVKQTMPTISFYLQKIAAKHGERYPYMVEVKDLFEQIKSEMELHLEKEESILFPRIKEIEASHQHILPDFPAIGYIAGPINMMEAEHEHAGMIMATIQSLTNHYTAPDDACTTFKVCIATLKEFEQDLHKHVHLENYILFPKSLALNLSIKN